MGIEGERWLQGQAFAKVNLHLSVGSRRPDGYHDIASLFQLVSLADDIGLYVRPAGEFSCVIESQTAMGAPELNTMYRGARLFSQKAGIALAVRITCVKRIPMQAGLGGGSSDAATVLRLLDRLFPHALDRGSLERIALEVGSDVPFFLSGTPAAFVSGRGECVQGLPPRADLTALIVMPSTFTVSTAQAFDQLDKLRERQAERQAEPGRSPQLKFDQVRAAFASPCGSWPFFNDFRAVMGVHEKWYRALDQVVQAGNGCFGTLSGSGAAYCCVGGYAPDVLQCGQNIALNCQNHTQFMIKCLQDAQSDGSVPVYR